MLRGIGVWLDAPHRDNVQAFEEKFDCFAMLPLPARPRVIATRSIELPAVDSGRVQCCRTSRHEYTGAGHIREPRRHAVGHPVARRQAEPRAVRQQHATVVLTVNRRQLHHEVPRRRKVRR